MMIFDKKFGQYILFGVAAGLVLYAVSAIKDRKQPTQIHNHYTVAAPTSTVDDEYAFNGQTDKRLQALEKTNKDNAEQVKMLHDRLWALAVLSQENWARLEKGDKKLHFLDGNGLPASDDAVKYLQDSAEVQRAIQVKLDDFHRRNKQSPLPRETATVPTAADKHIDYVNHFVQKVYEYQGKTEKIWIFVKKVENGQLVGVIAKQSIMLIPNISTGDEVTLTPNEVIAVQ